MENNLKDLDYTSMRYKVQKLISNKKKIYLEDKLNESIGKPKELWELLKSVVLPNKNSPCEVSALRINKTVQMTLQTYFEVDLKIIVLTRPPSF